MKDNQFLCLVFEWTKLVESRRKEKKWKKKEAEEKLPSRVIEFLVETPNLF